MRYIHGYTNYVAQNELNNWVSIIIYKMFFSEFPQAKIIIPCQRTIICNYCEQMDVSGDILNAGGNVEDQKYYGFTGSFFKITPIVIDDISKKKLKKIKRTPILNND